MSYYVHIDDIFSNCMYIHDQIAGVKQRFFYFRKKACKRIECNVTRTHTCAKNLHASFLHVLCIIQDGIIQMTSYKTYDSIASYILTSYINYSQVCFLCDVLVFRVIFKVYLLTVEARDATTQYNWWTCTWARICFRLTPTWSMSSLYTPRVRITCSLFVPVRTNVVCITLANFIDLNIVSVHTEW
jgi:hypothetical protein